MVSRRLETIPGASSLGNVDVDMSRHNQQNKAVARMSRQILEIHSAFIDTLNHLVFLESTILTLTSNIPFACS